MFALTGKCVAFGNDAYCVNDVMPDGVVGKHYIIATIGSNIIMSAANNITFAIAKTSLTEKERTLRIKTVLFSLSVCNMGLGLAHFAFARSNAMLALSGIFQILR